MAATPKRAEAMPLARAARERLRDTQQEETRRLAAVLTAQERWEAERSGAAAVIARERYAGILRAHVGPRWAEVKLADVRHADVQAWVSELAERRSPSTARKAHRVLSLVLALAVRDNRLARNPADGVLLPREVERDRRYLTHFEVRQLATAAGPYGLVITFLAYTGLRLGETAALRVSRIDLRTRRIEVAESVTAVNGKLVWGTPKNHSRRWVSLPSFVAEQLAAHIAGKAPDDLASSHRRAACCAHPTSVATSSSQPLERSDSTDSSRTPCATRPPHSRSRPAPTSKSSSRCWDTSRRP